MVDCKSEVEFYNIWNKINGLSALHFGGRVETSNFTNKSSKWKRGVKMDLRNILLALFKLKLPDICSTKCEIFISSFMV